MATNDEGVIDDVDGDDDDDDDEGEKENDAREVDVSTMCSLMPSVLVPLGMLCRCWSGRCFVLRLLPPLA